MKPLLALPVLFALALAGCEDSGEGGSRYPDICFEGPAAFSETPLPIAQANIDFDCNPNEVEPPSVEVWAGSADSVLVGTIAKVCALWEPAWVTMNDADPPFVSREQCTGLIESGITIELEDVETLLGEHLGDRVTISLGADWTQRHRPNLHYLDGTLQWTPASEPGRFEPGQRIGGAMFVDPDLGFVGPQKHGVFFQVDLSETIHFQSYLNEHCYKPVPPGVDGISLSAATTQLQSLDLSDPATQAKIQQRRSWYPDQTSRVRDLWGAKCFPGSDCDLHVDCPAGGYCDWEGFCHSECATLADCAAGESCYQGRCLVPEEFGLVCPLFSASRTSSGGITGEGDGLEVQLSRPGIVSYRTGPDEARCHGLADEGLRCSIMEHIEYGPFLDMPDPPEPGRCPADALLYHISYRSDETEHTAAFCDGMTDLAQLGIAFRDLVKLAEENVRCE